ncbi:Transcription initiation protein spt3 [Yamadazyma tenuis]|uniref:TFIID-18kDa-domain-containing protein n=1 Tax=Candida tenuis (strain ATCC 10573 / BCRC 21748 / CBS 615 / JCM 9827 / NBRC 10315 / NRRL Y-1498 / VKM Y-70) TaxID=590646 RepID=G3AXE4_CANTC|nr:TFIID-18kDa-domain-containing protein [Yamadazyma tenuis ATCC 10573]EGV66354.1 TFIID-18kDa-domain-containing protein [Yamadazyma tenuis ATCC 10573]WEJ95518.1 Transcription initiation protein spt3 [Yamadazyma tenuis]
MSSQDSKYRYRVEIQQMMFVSGESNDQPVETTSLIEDIVRSQVIDILVESSRTANSRGTRSIAPEDVIFMIRHDKAKVNRLRTYLSWKDVRKNAKDQEGGGTESLIENEAAAGPTTQAQDSSKMLTKYKKSKIRLPWELQFMFSEQHLETPEEAEQVDDDEKAATLASLKRLKMADDRTRNMTREEYVHWSECRQASFTFRKARRFREWAQISQVCDSRPNDDVIDILGFLTFEMVCSLTEEAMEVKKLEEKLFHKSHKNNTEVSEATRKRKYLFDKPNDLSTPILPYHIAEAWRRLQAIEFRQRAARGYAGGKFKSKTRLI